MHEVSQLQPAAFRHRLSRRHRFGIESLAGHMTRSTRRPELAERASYVLEHSEGLVV